MIFLSVRRFGPGNGAGCFAVGSCAASRVVSLLADPYYCGVLDPSFPVLVADMYMYFFSSPELLLLALGEQLRRFMRPVGCFLLVHSWLVIVDEEKKKRVPGLLKRVGDW